MHEVQQVSSEQRGRGHPQRIVFHAAWPGDDREHEALLYLGEAAAENRRIYDKKLWKHIRNLQGHPQGEQLHVHAHCIENVFQDTDRGLPENPENQIYQQTGEFSCCSKFLEKRELVD